MAGKTNTSATFFAQKKLLGKAHTSNLKIDGEEVIGSNIQAAASLIFGETIPTSPSLTLNSIQSSVEYIQFTLEALTGTTYDANTSGGGSGADLGEASQTSGPHTYKFKFPNNYESITSNTGAGSGGFSNSSLVHESLGSVQLVPPFFSQDAPNPYIVKIYQDNGGSPGTEIPLLDNIDWNIDYYNGILFLQDYNGSKVPAFAKAFAYTGKMLNQVVNESTGSGGGAGDPGASYLVLSATGSLTSERVINIGTGLKFTDSGAGGNYSIEVEKELIFNDVLAGTANGENTHFVLSSTPFTASEISVFVNGLLQIPPDKLGFQDFSVTGSSVYFTTSSSPPEGSWIMANYYVGVI